ncbi:fatty-acid amide hydrolase 2-A-like isoform X4 [Parasteatoda tepidariorum]|nr:fatty-acid amide hydrolase 2-A-like isoform X2 [Parasteatoda tepidariorum]XP_042911327.1 fatty-acid amide hydrolase 2-A-like isoform X2 [Parasteatoda tepidariorum]
MSEITWWLKRTLLYIIAYTFRIVLTIVFWGEQKSVPPARNQLLLKSAKQLAKEIREGKLKSEEVIQTYINRIVEVEPYINAVVQDNFDNAIIEARRVDDLIESGEFSIEQLSEEKPLLGVPFTVKCILRVKGFPETAGSLIFKDRIAETDAPIVSIIKDAGGIFLALTNAPEFSFSLETDNKLYGRTCNPYDVTRTCGGSSGGEAALISSAGSVIGLGNDLLGSLRVPAHFCGLFAHKSSRNLIPTEGISMVLPPILKRLYTAGPMCRFSEDLITMMKILLKSKKWMHFQKEVDFKNLKIYYQRKIEHAWIFNTENKIEQAVRNAALHFNTKYGTKVKEIKVPLINQSMAIILNSYYGRVPNVVEIVTEGKIKNLNGMHELIKLLCRKCQFTFYFILPACFGKWISSDDINLISQCDNWNRELENEFERLLDENSLFLFPTFPHTAPYHNESLVCYGGSSFTGIFNILGLPVTQCPIGFDKHGLPLGIQIVGKKGNDMLTLLAAAELEKAFGGWMPQMDTTLGNKKDL